MVMLAEPLQAAIRGARRAGAGREGAVSRRRAPLDHAGVVEPAQRPGLILLARRYEGVDERLIEAEVDEEWSIGDYVLSGGELAAMVIVDAVTRQLPGVLGNEESSGQDSYATGLLECAQYTRPPCFNGRDVPEVVLSGDHERIRRWRLKQALGRTWRRRPELLQDRELDEEQRNLLDEFRRESGHSEENER